MGAGGGGGGRGGVKSSIISSPAGPAKSAASALHLFVRGDDVPFTAGGVPLTAAAAAVALDRLSLLCTRGDPPLGVSPLPTDSFFATARGEFSRLLIESDLFVMRSPSCCCCCCSSSDPVRRLEWLPERRLVG